MHFLEKLAIHILSFKQEELQNLFVILPNIRAKLFLSNFLKKHAEKALFLPISLSSAELMEKLSGLKSADDYLLLSKLYNAYPTDQDEHMTFDLFMNWGSSILQDFKELDHQMVDTKKLFNNLKDIKRIELWNPAGEQLSEFQKKYLNFCDHLNSVYTDFTKNMFDEGIGHPGFIERNAVTNLNESIFNKDSRVIIAGFNALTKAEESIFQHISNHFKTEIFWDYDHYYVDNPLHEAGHFSRINRNKFPDNFNWTFNDFSEIKKEITVYKCSTSYEQSFVVSEILRKADLKDDLIKTAIILPDESLLLPVLQSIPKDIKDINVTMGYPLPHSPYYALFETLIRLYINIRNAGGNSMFYYKDVNRLLNNDAIKQISFDLYSKIIDPFLQKTVQNKQIYVETQELNEILDQIFTHQKLDLKGNIDSLSLMILFKKVVFNLDKILIEKDELFHKINREFLLHHFEVIVQVDELLKELDEVIDLPSLHRIWQHYSKLTKVQFTGEPLLGLQVMGLLESRNLDFDHVIILNANEGTLPSDKKYGSMIPNDLKRQNGMHLHSDKDAVIAYHFYRLLQRAKKVDILYSSQTENLGGGEKSRFIIQLERELQKSNTEHTITHKTAVSSLKISSSNKREIVKSNFIVELIKGKLNSGLSPTSITNYINCPLNFYFSELVGLKEKDEMIESLEANILGSAIHDTMELLYQPYVGKSLTVSDIENMEKSLESTLKTAFIKFIDEAFLIKGKNLLSYRMAEKMVRRFLQKEKIYVKENKIEIVDLEIRLEKNIEINSEGETVPVKVKGFVDRIEKRNGILHLIDYKTGAVDEKDLRISEMSEIFEGKEKALQLMTYTWLLQGDERFKDIEFSTSIYAFKSYNKGYMSLENNGEVLLDENDLQSYEEALSVLIKDMLEDTSPLIHKEESKYCNYC